MKKQIFFILAIFILLMNLSPIVFASETGLKTPNEIRQMQTSVYETNNPQLVLDSISKVLGGQEYKVVYRNEDLMYLSASKNSQVRDISKPLLAGYAVRIGWDICQTILTYGIKAYTLVGDIILIKIEFKDKDLQQNIGISVTSKGNQTEVKVNMTNLMIGKRDGLYIGKKNRLKTVHLRDDTEYKLFFYKLNKELESKNIKRVAL